MTDPFTIPVEEKIDPARTALVVVDYQNDFVAEEGAFERTGTAVDGCRAIAPALRDILRAARGIAVSVIFVQSEYSTTDNRYLSRVFLHQARRTHNGRYHEVPVCEPGSWGWDFYDDVRPVPGETVVVKHRFSAFVDTDLELVLHSQGIQTIVAAGVMTSGCVESTVRDAFFRDYFVVVPRQCCGAQTAELHDGALERIDRLYGEVVDVDEVVRIWTAHARTSERRRRASALS